MPDLELMQKEALEQGYKDETCSKCGTLFKAYVHFVRCDAKGCPMVSTKDSRTLLKQWVGSDKNG